MNKFAGGQLSPNIRALLAGCNAKLAEKARRDVLRLYDARNKARCFAQ